VIKWDEYTGENIVAEEVHDRDREIYVIVILLHSYNGIDYKSSNRIL
jgi:hypothetical protein